MGQPEVRVFDGVTATPLPSPLGSFLAFNQGFLGGVRVAACDLNQDGATDIIAGRGPGAQPEVRTFEGVMGTRFAPPIGSFLAFNASFKGGVYVACSPIKAAPGCPNGFCGWEDGDVITYSQSSWGNGSSTAGQLLLTNYDTVYVATFGVVEVGIPGAAGFSMSFTSPNAVLAYLPAIGLSGPLTSDLVDPTSSPSGDFGGDSLALQLNVDFSDSGVTLGASGVPLGDLTLCGFATPFPDLNGMTVRQFLATASTLLGGGSAGFTIDELEGIANQLNASFGGGIVTTFARDHLVIGACP